ncbi:hypothetical protein DFP73DRAFT_211063 [Morchella snyderi]|nr:hypothetical protein DFP73DRAFT_211063 [Morchella snyderi]
MKPTTILLTALVALLPLAAHSKLDVVNGKDLIEGLKQHRQAGGTNSFSRSSGYPKINRRSPAVAAKQAPKTAAAKKTSPKPKAKGTPKAAAKKGAPANTKAKGAAVKGRQATAKGAAASCPMPQKGGKKGKLGKRADCGATPEEEEATSGRYALASLCPGNKGAKAAGKGKRSLAKRTPVELVNEKDEFCAWGGGKSRFSGKMIREAAVRGRDQYEEDLPAFLKWRKDVYFPAVAKAKQQGIRPGQIGYPKDKKSGTRLDYYPKKFGNKVGGNGADKNQDVISQDEIKKCSGITVAGWNKDWFFIEYPIFPSGTVYDAKVDPKMKPESDRVLFAYVTATQKIHGVWLITHIGLEANAVRVGMRHAEKKA